MPPKKNAGAVEPEGLQVLPDGRIRLAWPGHDLTLRRPIIEEWLAFLEEGEAADEWRPVDDEGNPHARGYRDLLGTESPYRGLYARVIEVLAAEVVAREELPPWMSDGRLMGSLSEAWLSVPLIRSQR